MSPVEVFPAEVLSAFSESVFIKMEIPPTDARLAAGVLAMADLRGIDSHGVARLITYHDMLKLGRINPRPNVKVIRDKKSVGTVDGDNGLGLVVGPKAMGIAMDKAAEHGSGWIAVCNTNHYGIAAYYSLQALERDMIGWSMTNTTKLVSPLWGAERMLGTNPIAIAFPGAKNPPIVVDLATSTVAYGKIEIAIRRGERIPKGWILDRHGKASTNPGDIAEGGSLLPLGSEKELGGHKGYALSAMVDLLTAVLSGANWGPFAPPFALRQEIPERTVGMGIGHFFGAMEIGGFMEVNEFKARVDDWIETFRNTKPGEGHDRVLTPGDPEHEEEKKRKVEGIPLLADVVSDLKTVSRMTGVPFPSGLQA